MTDPHATQSTQTYATHRVTPTWYLVAGVVLALQAGWSIYGMLSSLSFSSLLGGAAGLAMLLVWFGSRRYAQIMQDRIIRLEMRLRLAALMPGRQAELLRLSLPQLVALRFASDAELPALVERVLAGEFATADAIKRAVKDWQPDHLRV